MHEYFNPIQFSCVFTTGLVQLVMRCAPGECGELGVKKNVPVETVLDAAMLMETASVQQAGPGGIVNNPVQTDDMAPVVKEHVDAKMVDFVII